MRWVENLTKVVDSAKERKHERKKEIHSLSQSFVGNWVREKKNRKEIGIAGAGDRPCGEWRQLRLRLGFVSSSDEKRLSLASFLHSRVSILLQQNQLKPLRGFAFSMDIMNASHPKAFPTNSFWSKDVSR
jgi:hypothetical protein